MGMTIGWGKAGRWLLGAVFLLAGAMKLAAVEFEVQSFTHFGYALWFMYAIGALELAGGLLLLSSRTATVGALLMLPVMVGAGWSHLAVGDGVAATLPALVLFALLGAVAWSGRDRVLPAGAPHAAEPA